MQAVVPVWQIFGRYGRPHCMLIARCPFLFGSRWDPSLSCKCSVFQKCSQVLLVSAGSKGTWKIHGGEGLVIREDRQGCITCTHSLPQQHLLLTLQNNKGWSKGPSLAQSSVCGTGYLKLEHKASKPVGHRMRQEGDKELLFIICHILQSRGLEEMDWTSFWGWLFSWL